MAEGTSCSISVSADAYENLRQYCIDHDVTMASVVEAAIERHLTPIMGPPPVTTGRRRPRRPRSGEG